MAKQKKQQTDSIYFLKIILFFILGSLWLHALTFEFFPGISNLPLGLFIGLVFARHEHFRIDRKIEYVVLLAASIISYAAPVGVVIQI